MAPGSGTAAVPGPRWMLANWCRPSANWGCPQSTEIRLSKPVKSKVWNAAVPTGTVTVKDSITVPPPAFVPVKVTVGAGSKAKSRAVDRQQGEGHAVVVCQLD